ESCPRLRREHERLLLPRLQRGQATFRATGAVETGNPVSRDGPVRSRAGTELRSRHLCRRNARDAGWAGAGSCRAATSGYARIAPGVSTMKFLCVPCDTPMKLQTVAPPERGSLSIVYSCPECGYEIAMLTNAYETQAVQSLGVRIGPETTGDAASAASTDAAGSKCPFSAMIPTLEGTQPAQTAEPAPVRWTAAAEARLANIPSFVRPM